MYEVPLQTKHIGEEIIPRLQERSDMIKLKLRVFESIDSRLNFIVEESSSSDSDERGLPSCEEKKTEQEDSSLFWQKLL